MRYFFILLLFAFATSANAITLEQELENPQQEQRAKQLFHEIRCMVCAGESIADSRTQIAAGLRHYVREKIRLGKSDKIIVNNLRTAYGDEIMMRPPVQENTLFLWLTPFLLFLIGGICVWKFVLPNKSK